MKGGYDVPAAGPVTYEEWIAITNRLDRVPQGRPGIGEQSNIIADIEAIQQREPALFADVQQVFSEAKQENSIDPNTARMKLGAVVAQVGPRLMPRAIRVVAPFGAPPARAPGGWGFLQFPQAAGPVRVPGGRKRRTRGRKSRRKTLRKRK